MRKHWLTKDYDHIPMSVKTVADLVLTEKFEAERELELSKSLLNDAVVRCSSILSEDNTAENIEMNLKEKFERLLQAYVLYIQLDDYFVSLLEPYAHNYD